VAPENPFAPAPSRSAFLPTLGCAEAHRRLDEGLGEREPFLLITGEPGIGKTALATEALARWDVRVTAAWLAYPALAGNEFLEEMLRRLGAEPPADAGRSRLLAAFEATLATVPDGRLTMIVVDDAHLLTAEHLEELRLLANVAQRSRRPFEVLLLGLPALAARLDEAALAALKQRIAVRATLEPLPPAETRRYLQHRVTAAGGDGGATFPKKTCREIAARTLGVPRQVNVLAAEALRVARAWGDRAVGVEHVQTAAAALGGFLPRVNVDDSEVEGGEAPSGPRPLRDAGRPVATTTRPAPIVNAPAPPPSEVVKAPAPPVAAAVTAPPPPSAVKRAEAAPASARSDDATREAAPIARPIANTARIPEPPVDEYPDNPVTATHHDPGEWVKRFVGDKGPLQISSRARFEGGFDEPGDDLEAVGADGENPAVHRERGRPPSRGRGGRGTARFAAALLAGLALVGVLAWIAWGLVARLRTAHRMVVASTESSRRVDRPASLDGRGPAVTAVPAPGSATPVTAATPPPATVEPATEAAAKRPFTIDVGGQPDLDAAFAARDRLSQLTGIHGWVVPGDANGGPYRVVLGIFKSQERAAAAAGMLVRSRTLAQANVVTLPPPRERQ